MSVLHLSCQTWVIVDTFRLNVKVISEGFGKPVSNL